MTLNFCISHDATNDCGFNLANDGAALGNRFIHKAHMIKKK